MHATACNGLWPMRHLLILPRPILALNRSCLKHTAFRTITYDKFESDVRIRISSTARIVVDIFLRPDFHEVPLDAFVVVGQIHAVRDLGKFIIRITPGVSHVNLIERTNTTLGNQ